MGPGKINLSKFIFLFTVLVCSAAEIILLEVKFYLFTGGFLQYNQLTTLVQRGGLYSFSYFLMLLYLEWHI